MKRKTYLSALFFLLAFSVQAQQAQLSRSQRKELKKAYALRHDIDGKVLRQTEKWPAKVAVLHSDWLENPDGKSIDLQGNELFPQYDYVQLQQRRDSIFIITGRDGRRGALTREGKELAPMAYRTFDLSYLSQGVLVAHGAQGTDVYGLDGQKLGTASSPADLSAYCDTCRLLMHDEELMRRDMADFIRNPWIQQFKVFYQNRQFIQAHQCLNYYYRHERQTLRTPYSSPNSAAFLLDLECHLGMGEFQEVVDRVEGLSGDKPFPQGLRYNREAGKVELDPDDVFTSTDSTQLTCVADAINLCRKTAHEAYWEERNRPRRTNILGTALAAIGVVGLIGFTFILDLIAEDNFELTGSLIDLLLDSPSSGARSSSPPRSSKPSPPCEKKSARHKRGNDIPFLFLPDSVATVSETDSLR